MSKIKQLWQNNKLLLLAFSIAALFTVFFVIRTVVFTLYWADPAHRDQNIEPWMTIRYVSYSWELPRKEMVTALGFEPENGRLMTFGEIATEYNITLDEMTVRIQQAAETFRETTDE